MHSGLLDLNIALLWATTIAGQEMPPALWWALSVWTFAVGGAIGSFLNVVVYRMPAGLSIVHPSSFCPSCKHPIRWRHNLPIVGWLILGGRCYDCGAKFSPRYPIVEALTAALFALLCQVEVFSGGANLPHQLAGDSEVTLLSLWAVYGYHVLLCCGLLCCALIEFDGHRIPIRLWGAILVCGLVAPQFVPDLQQLSYSWPFAAPSLEHPAVVAALSGLCGIALAAVFAWPTPRLARMSAPTASGFRVGLVLVGAFLGWQAVLILANAAMLVYLITVIAEPVRPGLRRVPLAGILGVLTLALIIFWRPLVELIGRLS